ncbi:MAG: hypothetical protein F6J93_22285 [Oscillatoria sp. SIO1A7]|nr:hypothetical protein [Oscillatoria sp. SIO1A7]
MKIKSLASIPAAIAIALGATASFGQPAAAQSDTSFYCGTVDGKPTTLARTSRGNIPMIHWETEYFSGSGWTPQKRCEEVSRRFQEFNEKGWLAYLTTGELNGYNVICVTEEPGEHSDRYQLGEAGMLMTLRNEEDNPSKVLRELMEVRDGARNSPLLHSNAVLEYDSQGRLYVDLEEFLFRAATVQD